MPLNNSPHLPTFKTLCINKEEHLTTYTGNVKVSKYNFVKADTSRRVTQGNILIRNFNIHQWFQIVVEVPSLLVVPWPLDSCLLTTLVFSW